MFDSLEAMLAADRKTNRSRSRRARSFADAARVPADEVLVSGLLLETWMRTIAAGMQDALEKDPHLSMRAAVTIAINQEAEKSVQRKPKGN